MLRKWELVNTEVGRGDCRPGQLEGESPVNYPWGCLWVSGQSQFLWRSPREQPSLLIRLPRRERALCSRLELNTQQNELEVWSQDGWFLVGLPY